MRSTALSTTSDCLTIISQLLMIGIEVAFIGGGIYIYKKLTDEPAKVQMVTSDPDAVLVPDGYELVPVGKKRESTFKERWEKIGKIVKAVVG